MGEPRGRWGGGSLGGCEEAGQAEEAGGMKHDDASQRLCPTA